MRTSKFMNIFSLLILSCMLLSNVEIQEQKGAQSQIDLTKYNAISSVIDSLYNLIECDEQRIHTYNNEIKSLENEKIKIHEKCKSLNRDTSTCSISFNCDTLSQSLKRIDKKIKDNSLKISNIEQSIQGYQEKINIQKKQLQDASKSIVSSIKKHNGSLKLKFKGIDYHVFIANTDCHEIQMHWLNNNKKRFVNIGNLLNYLKKRNKKPLMITNAGMYTPELKPQGLYIEGNELRPLDLKSPKTDGNFYLKPNGVYYIDTFGVSHIKTTEEFQIEYDVKRLIYATQSGPMLLIKDKIHSSFKERSLNKKIRSGVGIIDDNRTVFAISLGEVNFYDFALLFKDIFGCHDALYLDGAISKMYLNDIDPNEIGGQFGALISIIEKKQ
ncbi:MAG: phosphodiester glycosidase family protein [Saprospiraceae bacterium]|nr:phosphodiester glycosidase family protein [Saprospiraceae bacterium]